MNDLFADLQSMQSHGIPQVITDRLRARHPSAHVLVTHDGLFRVDSWARTGAATRHPIEDQTVTDPVTGHPGNFHISRHWGREHVRWSGHQLELVTLTLPNRFEGETAWKWVVAPDNSVANQFFLAVTEWNRQVHGEILVFENGCFCKSEELQQDISAFSIDDLVLAGDLAEHLRTDLRRFLDSKALYARAKAPWKRGLLFLGPPGNGKTHAVKGLLRESKLPCIYVKSFSGRHVDPHTTVPKVFDRARDLAPCVIVLEDLDALIDDENRSLLLNELDGFARNEGLFTIATTNHPERLDPSLLHRPSRFDRKFQFALPEQQERRRYLERWAESLEPGMRPTPDALGRTAEATQGFTFAYLKELTLSSLMQFAGDAGQPEMDDVIVSVAQNLAKEIAALPAGGPPPPPPKRPRYPWDY